jgi:predicted small secreted protein
MHRNLIIALILAPAVLLGACNTTKGVGRDIESVGKKIEDVAD